MLFIAYTETDKFKTHDDTARLQLVNNKSNSFLTNILQHTTSKGEPILINTSLNAKGKPIVNSVEDFRNEVKLF
jgi:predicted NodU family carbamoyl transferase